MSERRKQIAALPFAHIDGKLRVLLITSRETRRWLVPKGWPKKKLEDYELASLEAYEEAGAKGRISDQSIGHYDYVKILDDGSLIECDVDVYPMLVESEENDWPEKDERTRCWVSPQDAASMVLESGLSDLLRNFSPPEKLVA